MSLLQEWKGLIESRDPAIWIDQHIHRNELNQPFALYPHQREVLRLAFDFDTEGRLPWDTIIYSAVKKSGKTSMLALLALYWGTHNIRAHVVQDMSGIMSCTGSCRVKWVNGYMVVISWDVTQHDQSEERNSNKGSSAWNRFHSLSMGSSFPNAFSFIARSASRYMWVVSMRS
jgi:hypothetical protein